MDLSFPGTFTQKRMKKNAIKKIFYDQTLYVLSKKITPAHFFFKQRLFVMFVSFRSERAKSVPEAPRGFPMKHPGVGAQ